MPALVLTNFTIKQLPDKNGNTYYLIKDDDTGQAYFCFERNLTRDDWLEIELNWQDLKKLALEYETNEQGFNKVSALKFADVII